MAAEALNASLFGRSFKWGVSAAACQTEGAFNVDGKAASIWDVFASRRGKTFSGHNPCIATDFYNRFGEDLSLMAGLGIPNFRFSVSWPRVLPDGFGQPNEKGLDFYDRLIDTCLEKNIEPWVTLYHWDLPQEIERLGGWTNRRVVDWFLAYAELCCKRYGDRVKNWMVLNEPTVFTGAGYFLGVHAPGRRGLNNFLPAMHHAALCQGEGSRVIRSLVPDAKTGTTFSCSLVCPASPSEGDAFAAHRIDALLNRLFLEPALGLGYPISDLPMLKRLEPFVKAGDEAKLKADLDFIGIQNYTREVVRHSWLTPYLRARLVPADKRNAPRTVMNWEVYPEAIYRMIKKFSAYPQVKGIVITENGAAFNDTLVKDNVYDASRIYFLEAYLSQVLRAKQEGCNVTGYFVWSFTDNFEWSEGYLPRFGLVYVDYATQQRFVKASGKWYSKFITSAGKRSALVPLSETKRASRF